MEQEKLYVIEEKTYEAHIDEEVHLYGLLHQLAFLDGKIKDREDVEAFYRELSIGEIRVVKVL